ncbi:MAG: DUF6876 family protein [Cyanobacteria bacterium J06632_19]
MKTPHEIITELKQFYGSATLYKHWLGLKYTEGIQHLAQEANCYWLLDAIASHQTKQFLSNPQLREFQIWHLQVQENSSVLICEWDTNQEVLRQEIEYTDFPLNQIELDMV